MPINPYIPLALERPQYVPVPDPLEERGRVLALRELLRRGELDEMKLAEARRQIEAERRLRDVLAANPDIEKALPQIGAIDPELGLKYRKAIADANRASAETAAKEYDFRQKAIGDLRSRLAAVLSETDPAKRSQLYALHRAEAIASGYYRPELIPEQMPEESVLRSWALATLPYDKQNAELRARAKEAHEAALRPSQVQKSQAEADQASLTFGALLAPAAGESNALWQRLRARLPEHLRAFYPAVPYAGAAEQAEAMGTTPAQRRAAADREATRLETKRHNEAMERIQRDRETARRAGREDAETKKRDDERIKRLRAIKAEEQELEREQAPLDQKRRQIGQILKSGKQVKNVAGKQSKEVDLTPEERARYQGEFQSVTERWQRILDRKQQIQAERQQLQAAAAGGPTATATGRPRQVDATTGRTIGEVGFTEDDIRRQGMLRGMTPEDIERAVAHYRASRR